MKQQDPLELRKPGSLPKPGPIGRIARAIIGGIFCYAGWVVLYHLEQLALQPLATIGHHFGFVWVILTMIWLFNYVTNIGIGVSFKRWPLVLYIASVVTAMIIGWWMTGRVDNSFLGVTLVLGLLYFYLFTSISFFLSALIATPGCEMRAIWHLYTLITGFPTMEHHCPAGPLHAIDQWEARQQTI